MKVLFINNYYYERGGAEKSLYDTARLLEIKGHTPYFISCRFKENIPYTYDRYFISDVDFNAHSLLGKLRGIIRLYVNIEAGRKVDALLHELGSIDIAHLNNIMYRIGPSIIGQLKNNDIPVVMHLRDYNLMCGAINLIANGQICEDCKDYAFLSAIKKRCKGGLAGSLAITTSMIFYHKIMRYFDKVNCFISPSVFLKEKYVEMGFKKKIEVIPNFLNVEHFEYSSSKNDGTFVYFGRLSEEKGIGTLLNVCKRLPQIKFKIIGTGPLDEWSRRFIIQNDLKNINLLGYLKGKDLYKEVGQSKAIIVPSKWYENSSKSILESMALGKPVIASRIGGNPELVIDGETGYLFKPSDEEDLATKIETLIANKKSHELGKRGREFIKQKYNPTVYYERLHTLYRETIATNC